MSSHSFSIVSAHFVVEERVTAPGTVFELTVVTWPLAASLTTAIGAVGLSRACCCISKASVCTHPAQEGRRRE